MEQFGLLCAIFGVGIADEVFGFADVIFCRWLLLTRNVDGMFSNFRESMLEFVQKLTEMVSWRGLRGGRKLSGCPWGSRRRRDVMVIDLGSISGSILDVCSVDNLSLFRPIC